VGEGLSEEGGSDGRDGGDAEGGLHGKCCDGGDAEEAVSGEGLEVSRDAGAGGGVEAGDGESDAWRCGGQNWARFPAIFLTYTGRRIKC
jgi:hypothetical protein